LDAVVTKLTFIKENSKFSKKPFRSPKWVQGNIDIDFGKGIHFPICTYSNTVPKFMTLWFICRRASACNCTACLEYTPGAQLRKTAHHLTKGFKSMVTCLFLPTSLHLMENGRHRIFCKRLTFGFLPSGPWSAECPG
jgi:hypothetical protein